jgi:TRAP-type C4-dicarboxylate transport system substrate-binding protein
MIAHETDNRVTFKFYPGGVMGKDDTVLKKIRHRQLHGGAVVAGSLSKFFPPNQIYAQPMKFKNLEEVEYIRQFLDQYIIDGLDNAGFVTFGLIGGGFAYIMSQEPIETVQDLKRQKVWIPDNDKISQNSIKAFGISPIPLSMAAVRTSLESGLINTVATSPAGAIILQWYTQIKYVINVPLIYLHAVLAIDKKAFLKISKQDQKIVTKIMTSVLKEVEHLTREDDIKAIETLKNRGIKFITPSPEAMAGWMKVGKIASEEMVTTGVLPVDIAKQIDTLLEDYHSKTHTTNEQ